MKDLSFPAAIVIGCVAIAISFYLVQVDKRKSIEKQQSYEVAQAELLNKQNECEALSSGVKRKWNNVVGVTYDNDFWKECVVTYTDSKTGEITTSPLRYMQDIKQ